MRIIILLSFIFLLLIVSCTTENRRILGFESVIIDENKAGRTVIGDVNMDGKNDIVVHTWGTERGMVSDGTLIAYLYPDWEKIVIRSDVDFFGDAVVIADLDRDGSNDIITCRGNDNSAQVWWYKNPVDHVMKPWSEEHIATIEEESEVKDIEVYDMDEDKWLDIVIRTKHFTTVLYQINKGEWIETKIRTGEREGMTLGDVDNDGDHDIVLNGYWLENPDDMEEAWEKYVIDELWFTDTTGGWQDFSVMSVVEDIDGDGLNDVVFSHSEKPDFPVIWYKSTDPFMENESWEKHEVGVVHYCHTLDVSDFDLDGDNDILAGTLSRLDETEMVLFLNLDESGTTWAKSPVDTLPVYKAAIGDIDNDGDMDITSSYNWETPPLRLWRNMIIDK